ncbi:MAG: hypothetical protein INR73_16005 [Williamsia sp.]|nr:hypothetical protein [Williamsia sp.]
MDRQDFLMFAAHEAESRFIRYTPVKIIDYAPPHKEIGLAPAGSVAVYIGPKGSKTLDEIRKAVKGENKVDIELMKRMNTTYKNRGTVSAFQVWQTLKSAPVFADVRYGARSLIKHMAVPAGLDFIGVPSPYNGGKLAPGELTLVEHYKEGTSAALEAVALRRMPDLTAAEQAAIKLVPENQLELNLAPNGSCCDSNTDFWIFVAVTITLTCGAVAIDHHIAEEEIKKMSPTATAIQLMDIRREALAHNH